MDYRNLYDELLELRQEIEPNLTVPELGIHDYSKIVALAATYSLQEYLANRIAEISDHSEDQ